MTEATFLGILKSHGVDCTYIRFNDYTSDDVFCVCERQGLFDVFYRERGNVSNLKTFHVFSDAVDDLIQRMSLHIIDTGASNT